MSEAFHEDAAGESVAGALEDARQELLDLSLRNALLNFRTLKSRGARILDERPVHVFRLLVREEKRFSFLPRPEKNNAESEEDASDDETPPAATLLPQPEDPGDRNGPAERHVDTKLQTGYTSEQLQSRLLSTFHASRRFLEEQGVDVLYLALGMLRWYDAPASNTERRAPLVMVPVELERTDVQARFRLRYTGEEIEENLSLRAKLDGEFGLRLPELPETTEDIDVSAYFDAVAHATEGKERWGVDREAVELGFFSFGTFLMYDDLDPAKWPSGEKPADHPVIGALLGDGFAPPEHRLTENDHLDEHLDPAEISEVMDADSSQTLALLDAKQGHNLVIQGPPGTGKSQTIANLIAGAIGDGKKVLFVSEKMAALDVVKRRLDEVDLGAACLELHSHKTRKKAVLAELEHTLRLGRPKAEEHAQNLEVFRETRERLNEYSRAVNEAVGESGVAPYEAYGRLLQAEETLSDVETPQVETGEMATWTRSEKTRRTEQVRGLEAHLAEMGTPTEHPFWGSRREAFLPTEERPVREKAQALAEAAARLRTAAGALAEALGLPTPNEFTPRDAERLHRAAERVIEAPDLSSLDLHTDAWDAQRDALRELLDAGQRRAELRAKHEDTLIPDAWDADGVLETRQHLSAHGRKWYRLLIGDWRRAKSHLAGLCAGDLPSDADERVALADAILEARRKTDEIDERDALGATLFGARWQGKSSDFDALTAAAEWTLSARDDLADGTLPSGLLDALSENENAAPGELEASAAEVSDALESCRDALRAFAEETELDADRRFGETASGDAQPLAALEAMGRDCADAPERLHAMVQFNHQTDTLRENGMAPLADVAATWPPADAHLVDLFEHAYCRALVERAFDERPALARFDGASHAQAVASFRERDQALFAHHRAKLALAHWEGLPKRGAAGAVGLLKHEFEKKSRHLPIRTLIEKAGRAMQRIKPVFMMSPMSVAKYLPPGSTDFDLVVFDEASQVRPVDAFGPLLRGDQAVVVGDTKQLPPTSFFDSMTEPEDPAEQRAGDLESILGLFNAKGAPGRMLRFHYRSRHESLIAVSNQEFYDNKLVVFPSPDEGEAGLGVHYHHLPETHYDRGGSRTNKGEAKRVAEEVMEHARETPHRTLGVATFSTAQMEAVQQQLEVLRREDPSCESFFGKHDAEPFFVKNLENVQGDERDRILISVGYGKDPNGKLSMNFGPLNRTGGERRLNVLVTRAKRRCEVFTNLRPEDIDLSRTNARGVEVLKRYLQFAATGELEMPTPTGGGVDSPFEAAVADVLRDAGCEVAHQVGVAGFRIDLAVKDPDAPGRYLVGIECDGASYHSARTARERDRTRQAVLEGLGWKIHRIWSTDWFRRPERELKNALAAVEEAKAAQGSSASSAPSSAPNASEEVLLGGNEPTRDGPSAPPTVTRSEAEDDALEGLSAPPYEKAQPAVELNGQALHEVRTERMAGWLETVAETEGPVHFEDAARRVLEAAGVSRLGSRLRQCFEDAAERGEKAGALERWNDFLFLDDQDEAPVRDRSALPSKERDFARIAPAEIAAAAERVVRASMGLAPEEVPVQVCRLLGFARTSEAMRERVRGVLRAMQRDGRLDREGAHLVVA